MKTTAGKSQWEMEDGLFKGHDPAAPLFFVIGIQDAVIKAEQATRSHGRANCNGWHIQDGSTKIGR